MAEIRRLPAAGTETERLRVVETRRGGAAVEQELRASGTSGYGDGGDERTCRRRDPVGVARESP